MSAPDLMKEAPNTEPPKKPEPPSYKPLIPDLGDIIHVETLLEEAADLDPVTGMPKLYHADDYMLAHIPKANQPSALRTRLAIVGAIGGSVTLLGVGAYAINQALKKRKKPPSDKAAGS